jgi:hypothetical protein
MSLSFSICLRQFFSPLLLTGNSIVLTDVDRIAIGLGTQGKMKVRFDTGPNAMEIASKRFQGKDMIFKIGNMKCMATMINMETNGYIDGRLFLRLVVAFFPSFPFSGTCQIIHKLGTSSVKVFSTHLVHAIILCFLELDLCFLRRRRTRNDAHQG